ncbi:four helix bundle protein [Ramlibacter sp. USB13]|uniref:Four helix bundle protein n=1 Tax=Ramlibacter cellulosilyticus TaxID=2764187 RepID=A0A923MPA1_9BURK|nr:four helix bundle protein [Ramlibacter cellulosilyticus]MBC5783332.1 four helix bundle protein [Ramlibacter cellulosilyticus]
MEVRSYKDLAVWQKAMELTSSVYRMTAELPSDERFGLISQARRAAVSVPANIAEGHRRSSTKDYLRFLSIAAGSLAELETLIELASRLYRIQSTHLDELVGSADEVGRMLRGIQQKLEAKLPNP